MLSLGGFLICATVPQNPETFTRSALKVAEVDLATARSQRQQFQDISEANEAALARLTGTYDEYKATTNAQLVSREVSITAASPCK